MGASSLASTSWVARIVSSVHAFPSRKASAARARTGVAATPPYARRALRTTLEASISTTNAAAAMLMSSSRRFETLYESMRRRAPAAGAARRGSTTLRTISSASSTVLRYATKKSASGMVRLRPLFWSTTSASSASRSGGMSPMGEAVTMLPASVARFLIWRAANTHSILSIIGYSPPSASSIAVSVAPPPMT